MPLEETGGFAGNTIVDGGDARRLQLPPAGIGADVTEAIPDLIKRLSDEFPDIRYNAAVALGEIGLKANSAFTSLLNALKDDSSEVRFGAALDAPCSSR